MRRMQQNAPIFRGGRFTAAIVFATCLSACATANNSSASPAAGAKVLNEARIIVGTTTVLSQESEAITRFLAAQCQCHASFIRTTALGSSVYQLDLPSSVPLEPFMQKAQTEGRALGITYIEIDAKVFINQGKGNS